MYTRPREILLRGDIFSAVPIIEVRQVVGEFFPGTALASGPAILVGGDCEISKPRGPTFLFAPLFAMADLSLEHGIDGDIRRYRVRRFFYLPPCPELDDLEWVADLERFFVLPRDLFDWGPTRDAEGPSVRLLEDTGANRRAVSLDDEGRELLRVHLGLFMDLAPRAVP